MSFQLLSVANGTEWNQIVQRRGQAREVYPRFRILFPEVLFNFAPEISRIFGLMVLIPEIQQLAEFLETFTGNFCTICSSFQVFAKGKKV